MAKRKREKYTHTRFGKIRKDERRRRLEGRTRDGQRDDMALDEEERRLESQTPDDETDREHRSLDNDVRILDIALASVRFPGMAEGETAPLRPYHIWERYIDRDGLLQAVGCLRETTRIADIHGSDLYLTLQERSRGAALHDTVVRLDQVPYFRNTSTLFNGQTRTGLTLAHLPDFVLRRAEALLYLPTNTADTGFHEKSADLTRQGVVFRNVRLSDIANGAFAAETADSGLKQAPFEVRGFFTQDDIDTVVEIARNYAAYCQNKGLPIIWPHLGQWGQWPTKFMQFREPPSGRIHLPWFTEDHRYTTETGFPCDID